MRANEGYEYRERLATVAPNATVLDYLAGRYRHTSRQEWSERIEFGRVLVDGHVAEPDAPLRRGQTLCWRRPPWIEPKAPLCFAVLFEDPDLLVVAKPSGLPTLPGGGFLENTLLGRVRRYDHLAAPVHRLGRWTSGIVLFSKNRESAAAVGATWSDPETVKGYRAIADGTPSRSDFVVSTPIGPVPYRQLGSLHAANPRGKPSLSHVSVLQRRRDSFLADVEIGTGRPHQIRIHLAAAGHPLTGDPLFAAGGRPAPGCKALPGDPGYLLHAYRLLLPHPRTGRRLNLFCAPPPALRTRAESARGFAGAASR